MIPDTDITPLPVPTAGSEVPRMVVIFGGTFDPVHRAHVRLARLARDEVEHRNGCDGKGWLVCVPAARSPFKSAGPVASDADRAAMLALALKNVARADVWLDEIRRAAKGLREGERSASYTADTLGRARMWLDNVGLGGVQMHLLIGADQAAEFHRWSRPRDVLRLARPVVMLRGEVEDESAFLRAMEGTEYWDADELAVWKGSVVQVGRVDVSATAVREAARLGAWDKVEGMVGPEVAEYLRERRIYC